MGNTPSADTDTGMSVDVRALHIAVMKNDILSLQQLIRRSVDVNRPWDNLEAPSVKDGSTPLGQAVSLNHRAIAETLLAAGAKVNLRDRYGWTPLQKGAYHGRKGLVDTLIHAGADIHQGALNQNTVLHICVQNGLVHNSVDTVHSLVRAGALVNQPNTFGKISLHYATWWGLVDIIVELIRGGSDPDFMDHSRETPLFTCMQAVDQYQNERVTHRNLAAQMALIANECDTLNLAQWLKQRDIVRRVKSRCDNSFLAWYSQSIPASLKHLSRECIQRQLSHSYYLPDSIRKLEIPHELHEYLMRSLYVI
ncbi:PREDICTED: serine/threonine-protein phosphatase 6 regulatory ankyrin repeat subunit C-like [Priapulus caudatus]|uniref:Serine/threonine-protein phosphatase 6 regulatory ankyrin repeat subunit C-like n=1 Tax=Priapulus caudatus TaxID=37621 RepID=A0ABM1ET20_PRICU|nr:PREDICTED: serine/threonine-protein phosphatase 6 regulatory ankyrin repeat subunit C-like [Priapulus caudatus]